MIYAKTNRALDDELEWQDFQESQVAFSLADVIIQGMNHKQMITLTGAARRIEKPKQTLAAAVTRGEIKAYELACGSRVYSTGDIDRWASTTRKRGPKFKN